MTERRDIATANAWLHDPRQAVERRVELLQLMQDQHRMARSGDMWCACCRFERELPRFYRCYHCDLWLCPMCALAHFGRGPRLPEHADPESYAEGRLAGLGQLQTLMANHANRLSDGRDELASLRGLHNAIEFLLQTQEKSR